jgi:hypothetical protein
MLGFSWTLDGPSEIIGVAAALVLVAVIVGFVSAKRATSGLVKVKDVDELKTTLIAFNEKNLDKLNAGLKELLENGPQVLAALAYLSVQATRSCGGMRPTPRLSPVVSCPVSPQA